jgi:predicted neuraminidase
LAHHSKKVVATSFVAPVIWTHQVSAIAAEANFLAGVIDRTTDITVLLSFLSIAASSSSSLGHVQRVSAHKQVSKQFSG